MPFLLEQDALVGKEGRAFADIDGQRVEMFGLKKFQADVNFNEVDFTVCGTRQVQKKTTGVTMTGTMTIYYGTPEFVRLVQNYIDGGQLPYFTMQVINDAPSSTMGKQTIALYGVKLTSLPIAELDADANYLTADVAFSFTRFELLDEFNSTPAQLGSP
jgi:hypothetical protein